MNLKVLKTGWLAEDKGEKGKVKRKLLTVVLIITAILLLLFGILCVPRKEYLKDGGSVRQVAILWSCTDYHTLPVNGKIKRGREIKILGNTVYDNTEEVVEE